MKTELKIIQETMTSRERNEQENLEIKKKCSTYTLIYQKFIVKLFDVIRLGLEFKN